MSGRIGLVHATLNAVQPMREAFRRHAAATSVLHFLDEGLVEIIQEESGVTPSALRRLARLVEAAVASRVEGILLTCSSFSPFASTLCPLFEVPIVSVDQAMLERAVALGSRIAVVVTVPAAGPSAAEQIRALAAREGKAVEVRVAFVPEAFAALQAQDASRHDRLVAAQAAEMASAADVVVLAQISMASAAEHLCEIGVPVLTSPESAVRAILQRLTIGK